MNIDSIQNGYVIDHIRAGRSMEIYHYLGLDALDCSVAIIKNAKSQRMGKKDIIKIDQEIPLDLDLLGYIDPGISVNIIRDGKLVEKKKPEMPARVVNVMKCKNPRCITQTEQELDQIFVLADREKQVYRLYVGGRKNALDHLDAAYENGFSPFSTGCHVLIADGLKGTDETLVPIAGDYVKEAKIGTAIMDADVFISLTHFKGHEATGFGGCLKNIGMGCGSRAGKMEMHSSGKPHVAQEKCVGCGSCQKDCAHSAITITDRKASINHAKCVGCGRCIGRCPVDAVQAASDEANDILNCKIAEYTWAVIKDKPSFHISLVVDVSPYCDCHSENDLPIVPDVGMFASFDPIALDQACADAVNAQPSVPGSILDERERCHHDHFTDTHPDTNWESCLEHGVKLGLGTRAYELITIQ